MIREFEVAGATEIILILVLNFVWGRGVIPEKEVLVELFEIRRTVRPEFWKTTSVWGFRSCPDLKSGVISSLFRW